MANPDISLLGAVYPEVAGVTLPKQGGGTATFPWVEGSQNITQNGTVDVSNLAEVVVNVSGGGGASNVVTGTFKGTTTGTSIDLTLNYTGTGYPVAVVIYPKEGGNNTSGTFYELLQRYVCDKYFAVKSNTSKSPTYPTGSSTADTDNMAVYIVYKSSSSTATSRSTSSNIDVNVYRDADASPSSSGKFIVRLRSNTKMSVSIAANSYGFAANIDYTYHVIYSS